MLGKLGRFGRDARHSGRRNGGRYVLACSNRGALCKVLVLGLDGFLVLKVCGNILQSQRMTLLPDKWCGGDLSCLGL